MSRPVFGAALFCKGATMHHITFEGHEIAYDEKALHSWSVQKKLAQGGAAAYDAVDVILCGKSDEVAATLGDDADKMTGLLMMLGSLNGDSKN